MATISNSSSCFFIFLQAMHCTSCCFIPVSLEIQVLWAYIGLQSNPQAHVSRARFLYQCQSIQVSHGSERPLTLANPKSSVSHMMTRSFLTSESQFVLPANIWLYNFQVNTPYLVTEISMLSLVNIIYILFSPFYLFICF